MTLDEEVRVSGASLSAQYFDYWGKAQPKHTGDDRYHLLVFHSLDVAACGERLLKLPSFSLASLATDMDWPLSVVERVSVFFVAIHDLGKFARSFQSLVSDLSPDLVPADSRKQYTQRHDTLGWLLWRDSLADNFPGLQLPYAREDVWANWMRAVSGHHGMPPHETSHGGLMRLRAKDHFLPEDIEAARSYVADVAEMLLPDMLHLPMPSGSQRKAFLRHSWRLAGLAVLADWLGSNTEHFRYHSQPRKLNEYWAEIACPQAGEAVSVAGLAAQEVHPWAGANGLFHELTEFTPLQQYAATVELDSGPNLFLLEDVTGSGKTEAALILTHRLMVAGKAQGVYFALPTMATANQMYDRVGKVYRRFYAASATPSLILSHGARQLAEGFRQSILPSSRQPGDINYQPDEASASAQCSAWLADSRKKALLADVGVGTVDQALLGVLPVRHQSLRLLGLSSKVLLVDEVHAYDAYVLVLLESLLEAHAQQGGSAILLSATLPASMRARLVAAYRRGRGVTTAQILPDLRYPLATQVSASEVKTDACATRAQLVRRVKVVPLHTEHEVLELIQGEAASGHSVCWIRNTVEDARHAYDALRSRLPGERVQLFHSRFAMGDRLAIEREVVGRFGKESTAAARSGQVLVATQVVEQSLDLDFNGMITDLAPVDLVIQRAGRLQRHSRDASGQLAADGMERRSSPVLHIFCPEPAAEPAADWYAKLFPKAVYVYPDVGKLWLTQRVLLQAGFIVSPGTRDEPGGVRNLVEAVYGEAGDLVPVALERAAREQEGKLLADGSLGRFNALRLEKGYRDDGHKLWAEESRIPTRLGEESRTIYLAREVEGTLQPWIGVKDFAWEQSAVRIDARTINALAPEWERRFGAAITALREGNRLLDEYSIVLPLVQEGDVWMGMCERNGVAQKVLYDSHFGLRMEKV